MRVVVTGGAGYIGSVVTEEVLREGHDVIVVDDLSKGHASVLPSAVRFIRENLTNFMVIRDVLRSQPVDAVIHTAPYGLNSIYLRYFNAAAATATCGESHNSETHLIPLVLQVPAGQRNFIPVFGDDYPTRDGTCIRDYIHVRDIAHAHLLALRVIVNDVILWMQPHAGGYAQQI